MIIERGCSNHEDWVLLRQALWPDETAEEYRGYVLSLLNRTNDAIAKQSLQASAPVRRRDVENGRQRNRLCY